MRSDDTDVLSASPDGSSPEKLHVPDGEPTIYCTHVHPTLGHETGPHVDIRRVPSAMIHFYEALVGLELGLCGHISRPRRSFPFVSYTQSMPRFKQRCQTRLAAPTAATRRQFGGWSQGQVLQQARASRTPDQVLPCA